MPDCMDREETLDESHIVDYSADTSALVHFLSHSVTLLSISS